MADAGTAPVLTVRNLKVEFTGSGRAVPVVRGVDFDVYANEVLCIVGESGSGKSVTALAVTGLLPETARVSGSIKLGEVEVIGAEPEVLRQMRGRDVGFIFQDPTTTLNPVLQVGRQITEGQVAHGLLAKGDAHKRAADEEHAHAAGEAADEAPDGEEHQRRVEHHPRRAPVDLAAGGNAGDDLRDEERVEHPSVEMLAIEITRQRRGDRGDGKALEGDEGDAEDRADRQGDDRCVPNGRRRP